ncbi:MAG: nuclear transport factor 2 family protein [Actinobacteria bacterium]|nr:nuclear transport factor 2 family protein [Actinomycetota bacterium]
MSPEDVVHSFISAIEHQDLDAALALVTESVSYENMPMDPVVGSTAVRAVLEGYLAPVTEVEWKIISQWCVGDTVINERLDRFRIGDGWLELPVAGIFRVEGDRITLWRDYFDMGSYVRQFTEITA